jgi:dolichol-phosphate mannosyltransferase
LVVVPTYNDVVDLAAVLQEVVDLFPDATLLVVDDGSTPPVKKKMLPQDVLLSTLPANYGLGVAMHVAFDHALQHGFKYLVRIDADGQHPTDRIPDMIAPLAGDEADVVVGIRTNRNGDRFLQGLAARLVRSYFSVVASIATGGRTPADLNSGYLSFDRTAMEHLNRVLLERYPEPQLLLQAARGGLRLRAIPVVQSDRAEGRSTLGFWQALRLIYSFSIFLLVDTSIRRSR